MLLGSFGRFNGDGKLGLVVGDLQFGFTVLLGSGACKFVAKSIGPIGQNLNKDGKLDLVIVSSTSGGYTTYVLLGNGDGTFKQSV